MGYPLTIDSDDYYAREIEVRHLRLQNQRALTLINRLITGETSIQDVTIGDDGIRVAMQEPNNGLAPLVDESLS